MVVPQEVQEVCQWPLGQAWQNMSENPPQGQSVGTQGQRKSRPFGHGQDGGLGWAEAGETSFVGSNLSAVACTEQCSPEYGVC